MPNMSDSDSLAQQNVGKRGIVMPVTPIQLNLLSQSSPECDHSTRTFRNVHTTSPEDGNTIGDANITNSITTA
ncbi:hypothetical protein YUMDRAFT_00852 [Streptomyces sp. OspMP-M45]|nr:hypothetical protein YUMDRAFT_00852 [Streptomyces sp. OspMP-M45]